MEGGLAWMDKICFFPFDWVHVEQVRTLCAYSNKEFGIIDEYNSRNLDHPGKIYPKI
jgi:hypothetical protein